jgi:hypothetical protein
VNRRTFLAGCATAAAVYPSQSLASADALGHLDHSFWTVSDGAAGKAAFRKLGFTLTPKPMKLAEGVFSTFAEFRDRTYLEIVESHLADATRWIASGANPQQAGGIVESCAATARALAQRGIRMSIGAGPGYCQAEFPHQDKLLGNVFLYSYPGAYSQERSPPKHPEYVQHLNGALGVRESWIAVPELEPAVDRFTRAGFPIIVRSIAVEPLDARGTVFAWGSHRIVLLQAASAPFGPLAGAVARLGAHPVGVRLAADMTAARRVVGRFAMSWESALIVGPGAAKGSSGRPKLATRAPALGQRSFGRTLGESTARIAVPRGVDSCD